MFVCLFVCLFVCFRATTLEEKGEQFWYQGDFGYVKQVVDSLMELCAPQALVRNQAIHVVMVYLCTRILLTVSLSIIIL